MRSAPARLRWCATPAYSRRLPIAVAMRVGLDLFAGDLAVALARLSELDTVIEAIVTERSPTARIALAALHGARGRRPAVGRGDDSRDAVRGGDGRWVAARQWSTAVLCPGLGRYDQALAAAQQGIACPRRHGFVELGGSRAHRGGGALGPTRGSRAPRARLGEMAHASGTDSIVGVEARARALVADTSRGDRAHGRHAAGHRDRPLVDEWPRRAGRPRRRAHASSAAHDMRAAMGAEGFPERAGSELRGDGRGRKRAPAHRRVAPASPRAAPTPAPMA